MRGFGTSPRRLNQKRPGTGNRPESGYGVPTVPSVEKRAAWRRWEMSTGGKVGGTVRRGPLVLSDGVQGPSSSSGEGGKRQEVG